MIDSNSPSVLKRSLKSRVIGISASLGENHAAFGMKQDELDRVLSRLCEALLGHGARLAFGHDWRPDGVMDVIVSMALQYKLQVAAGSDPRDLKEPRVKNFVHSETQSAMPAEVRGELQGLVEVYQCEKVQDGSLDRVPAETRFRLALLAMRGELVASSDTLISIGGPTFKYAGWFPGILEEVLRNLQAGHGVFLCRSFGGITAMLYDAYLSDDPEAKDAARKILSERMNEGLVEMATVLGTDHEAYGKVYELWDVLKRWETRKVGGTMALDADTIVTEFLIWDKEQIHHDW
tara:strand:+ start:10422 stop:11297 length:876 start_codon:yes stop_codon:yes gene_type:complete